MIFVAGAKVGVGEKVDLKAPCPADWTIQGGGTLSTTTGATTQFTAPETAAQVIITAKLHVDNSTKTVTFNVVEPSGATFRKIANIVNQTNVLLQSGFVAEYFILPADVNFTAIAVYEDATPAITTGHYKNFYPQGFPHKKTNTVQLVKHTQNLGTSNPNFVDKIDTGLIPRFGNTAKYTSVTSSPHTPSTYILVVTDK